MTVQKGGADQTGQMGGPGRADGFGENVITASGSTSVGMQEETFDLDYIETELKIEEVYLSSGDEVEEGTPILKLTDESVEAARRNWSRSLFRRLWITDSSFWTVKKKR